MGNNSLKNSIFFRCNGGDHDSAFQYFINQGIVTGGAYHSHKGCKPYPIKPGKFELKPNSTICESKCQLSYTTSYSHDKIKGQNQITFAYNNRGVMDEIMKNGPVVAEFELYENFYDYAGGVYQYKEGKLLGYYYAKIIGWDKDDTGLSFWQATASFGRNWGKKYSQTLILQNLGENGTFRIAMRLNDFDFESNIIAGLNRVRITSYFDYRNSWE
jgi:cathepsin B